MVNRVNFVHCNRVYKYGINNFFNVNNVDDEQI